jgi:hypothetical protein
MKKRLPVGVEGFEKIVTNDFYFVDKTLFISELLHNWGEVNLFTRPRRFGKSLNMSMLKSFFEIEGDKTLFEGLKITKETKLCEEYMGRFPVVSITLKSVEGLDYQAACAALRSVIGMEAMRFDFLANSNKLTEEEHAMYRQLIEVGKSQNAVFAMSDAVLLTSLKVLSRLLGKHYGSKVILLIDEYDVPLDKAFQSGYYEEMVSLVRGLLGNVLKTNEYLQFAVLTGCLRISRESIFTGLNNLNVMTVTDEYFADSFGFTNQEVEELLEYYGLEDAIGTVKEWYDGYLFGGTYVYCPWDVVKYCQALLRNKNALPENYWANTSGNEMVRRFVNRADQKTRDEIEQLIAGNTIVKEIRQELTYKELDDSIENLWSVLFTTGYLTAEERLSAKKYRLVIPNAEIRDLFGSQVKEWFAERVIREPDKLNAFCDAILAGDEEQVQKRMTDYLKQTISIRDTNARTSKKEHFYHGMLLGLLSYPDNWSVKSNTESGDGFSDILIEDMETDTGVVIEVKYAEEGRFDTVCAEALRQIEEKNYAAVLCDDGMKKIIKYGIAFYKKRCRVLKA